MSGLPAHGKKKRLGEILIDAGVIDEMQLKSALGEQRKWGGKLGHTLVEMHFLDEDTMVLALSRQLSLPVVKLDTLQVSPEVLSLLRVDVAERYGVFPIGGDRKTKTLQVATSDPTNVESVAELAFHTNFRVSPSVASASAIDRAIRRHYYGETTEAHATGDFRANENNFETDFSPTILRNQMETTEPAKVVPAPAAVAPVIPVAIQDPKALSDRLELLERVVASQGKALRGALELLMEKKLITREEYSAKTRKP